MSKNEKRATPFEDKILLRIDEAAGVLCVSRAFVYKLIANNTIPAIRVGSVLRIPKAGLLEWVDRSQKDGAAPAA
jgi:excisionase family DNA binding protein